MQNGGFIKPWGQAPWAERAASAATCCSPLPQDYEEQVITYLGVGRSHIKGHTCCLSCLSGQQLALNLSLTQLEMC